MLTQSEHIDQLATALADVQALIDGVLKESPNAIYGSRYAELSKVWEAFQRVGPDHGLSVVQLPGQFNAEARTMSMSVRLMHSSGQWLGGEMSMPLSRADAHAYGSACTYARRYSLAALVGICPHDDDGNAASGIDGVTPRTQSAAHCRPRLHRPRGLSQAQHLRALALALQRLRHDIYTGRRLCSGQRLPSRSLRWRAARSSARSCCHRDAVGAPAP